MEKPMIYTKNGNVPEDSLRYEHEWINGREVLEFHERWFSLETGELVKNNMHGYVKTGVSIAGVQAVM